MSKVVLDVPFLTGDGGHLPPGGLQTWLCDCYGVGRNEGWHKPSRTPRAGMGRRRLKRQYGPPTLDEVLSGLTLRRGWHRYRRWFEWLVVHALKRGGYDLNDLTAIGARLAPLGVNYTGEIPERSQAREELAKAIYDAAFSGGRNPGEASGLMRARIIPAFTQALELRVSV